MRKRNKNMYDLILKEKDSLCDSRNVYKGGYNWIIPIKGKISDDSVKHMLSQQMAFVLFNDMEKMTTLMVSSIVGGIFSGRNGRK